MVNLDYSAQIDPLMLRKILNEFIPPNQSHNVALNELYSSKTNIQQ